MSTVEQAALEQFAWQPQPQAASVVGEIYEAVLSRCPAAQSLAQRLRDETGTRLSDWTDHLAAPDTKEMRRRLGEAGFAEHLLEGRSVWRQVEGMFPRIVLQEEATWSLTAQVESVVDCVAALGWEGQAAIEGNPLAPLRKARLAADRGAELWVVERHGTSALAAHAGAPDPVALLRHAEALHLRPRRFDRWEEGFAQAMGLIREAVEALGSARACDLFFAAEREYWQRRNRAGQAQKARQDRLGMGWGNHDHHTYRSSRECFHRLIAALEALGMQCRERFYAGREAGWGAQVMEHPEAGVVVFADVDLAPEEVSEDFAHYPLPSRDALGTVGLWCKLHGEAFLEAGMHHLEAQFDFDAARRQLEAMGIGVMKPFTDLPYLRQAFTEGERWSVDPQRIEAARQQGWISAEQAEQFRRQGALGSHLEILQRDAGYKGFNQSGISEIIQATDPRRNS